MNRGVVDFLRFHFLGLILFEPEFFFGGEDDRY
jgi:hypothetical protein